MTYKVWTPDEDDFVKACCKAGWFHKEIANELNRSIPSIDQRVVIINISNGHKKKLKTTEQYKKELKEKCPTMICLGKYINTKTAITHKCLKCEAIQESVPKDKLNGHACNYCGRGNNGEGIPLDKEGITYLVYIPKYDIYKIGITSRTIMRRMSDNRLKISEYTVILERKFSNGIDAINLEKKWKENLKEYLVNTGLLFNGNTETFRY